MLIDLSSNFFIVKLNKDEIYNRVLLDGPWMICENYRHVQRWKLNFRANKAEITSLPDWIRIPILPVEYYSERWLRRVSICIGRTINVDMTALIASRGKFVRL